MLELVEGMTAIIPGIRGGYTIRQIDQNQNGTIVLLVPSKGGEAVWRHIDSVLVIA